MFSSETCTTMICLVEYDYNIIIIIELFHLKWISIVKFIKKKNFFKKDQDNYKNKMLFV